MFHSIESGELDSREMHRSLEEEEDNYVIVIIIIQQLFLFIFLLLLLVIGGLDQGLPCPLQSPADREKSLHHLHPNPPQPQTQQIAATQRDGSEDIRVLGGPGRDIRGGREQFRCCQCQQCSHSSGGLFHPQIAF